MPKNITKMDRIPLAKKVVVGTSDDAQSSFLQFETVDGPIKVGLRNFELSKLVSLLIGQSEKVALSQLQINQTERLQLTPSLQFKRLRSESGRAEQRLKEF